MSSEIIYTCPRCGHDLFEEVVYTLPPTYIKRCATCGWKKQEQQQLHVIRTPYAEENVPTTCKSCPNYPSNDGSDICHCTLGLPKITC